MELQKTDSYARAYVEILEIINHMEEKYKKKIPYKLLDFFEKNKASDYNFQLNEIDNNVTPIFSDKTIGLLSMIEYKYWTTDEEKKILNKALKENEIKYRNKLREQYNPDDIFKNNKHKKEKENIVKNEIYITEYKESLFKKIINKIRNIFK